MELDIHYANFENSYPEGRTLPQIPSGHQDAGKAKKCRGNGHLVMAIAMCVLSLTCAVLLVFIILQHFSIAADRDLFKKDKYTVQVFNQTISRLQDTFSDLMTENKQLQGRYNDISDELKNAYEKGFKWGSGWFFLTNVSKSWSDSRQYCKDQGADLVIINTEVKQRFITSTFNGGMKLWIGLSDTYKEGNYMWVTDSQLKQGFWREGEPNDHLSNEDCVELVSSIPHLKNWNDQPCTTTQKAICEK